MTRGHSDMTRGHSDMSPLKVIHRLSVFRVEH